MLQNVETAIAMKTTHTLLALCGVLGSSRAEETAAIECLKSGAFFAAPDAADRLKYAPDREVDILHVAIDVTPDFTNRTVAGRTTIRFKALVKPVAELSL